MERGTKRNQPWVPTMNPDSHTNAEMVICTTIVVIASSVLKMQRVVLYGGGYLYNLLAI